MTAGEAGQAFTQGGRTAATASGPTLPRPAGRVTAREDGGENEQAAPSHASPPPLISRREESELARVFLDYLLLDKFAPAVN